ncbi:MAG: type II toxin-antitoxin system RelE/ParE family toxin [Steroidobacteraceae bacterium]
MRFKVLLTEDAERDLEDIYTSIAEHDSRQKADYVLDRLLEVTDSLATAPERGLLCRELGALGIQEYRQVLFKPYRVVYRHFDRQVVIYVIADGRRDMQSLLSRRVLNA